MKILNADLVTSASTSGPREGLLRDDLPQFAFLGRSNVGKSSLLNALTRQRIARTSAAAGKTRQANIYRVTADSGRGLPPLGVYLVDLPGYGYARGGAASVKELAGVVDAYFAAVERPLAPDARTRERRGAMFLLVDSRHPGLDSDLEAWRWVSGRTRLHVVATKIDKLTRAERTRNLREFERLFAQAPLPVSATSGEGLDDLWRVMTAVARGDAD